MTRRERKMFEETRKRVGIEILCCKPSGKVGRTRRGRKKHKAIQFPYPKRAHHRFVDGVTVPSSWSALSDNDCRKKIIVKAVKQDSMKVIYANPA